MKSLGFAIIPFSILILSSGCATLAEHSSTGEKSVKEWLFPGSDAFDQGQQFLADEKYFKGLHAFEAATQKDPDNEDYQEALDKARNKLVQAKLKEVEDLPQEALPQRIAILRRIAPSQIGPVPVLVKEYVNGELIYSKKEDHVEQLLMEHEKQLQEIETEIKQVSSVAERNPAEALTSLEALLPYEPYFKAVEELKTSLREKRGSLLQYAQQQDTNDGRHKAIEYLSSYLQVWPADSQASELRDRLVETEVRRLTDLAHQAKAEHLWAIAAEYYRHAKELNPRKDRNFKPIETLKENVGWSTLGVVFSDSIPKEYRQDLRKHLSEKLAAIELQATVEPIDTVNDTGIELAVEVRLEEMDWRLVKGEPEKVWSSFLAGYQKVPNPAYTEAFAQYQEALSQYNVNANDPYLGLSSLLLLQGARNKLSKIPQYMEEPVYQNYQYVKQEIQEKGYVSVEVAVVDLLERREYGPKEVTVQKQHDEVIIKGAHPKDKKGVQNHAYRKEESLKRQEIMRKVAFDKTVNAAIQLLVQTHRHRAETYFELGADRRGVEAMLRYGDLKQRASRVNVGMKDGKDHSDDLWDTYLRNGPPKSNVRAIEQAREARNIPSTALLVQKSSKPIRAASEEQKDLAKLSPEAVVKRAVPAIVSIQTFQSRGAGFLCNSEGLILTNAHVINEARDIGVKLSDGRQYVASVLKKDFRNDVAILKIEGTNFPALQLLQGNPSIGEEVIAIGSPSGLDATVTKGVISGIRKFSDISQDINYAENLHLIQTDAAINPGNSGGPLLDRYARVVGMNTLKLSQEEGIGFAIASSELAEALELVGPDQTATSSPQ